MSSYFFHIDFVLSKSANSCISGGYGSSGADGAAGGNVFITVDEEDTDLLLPLEYDVRGGAGGISGQHGEPGDGGIGGRGGQGHAWYVLILSIKRIVGVPNCGLGQREGVIRCQLTLDLVA